MVDFTYGTEILGHLRFTSVSTSYLNIGRTNQIRTGDLYHVNIDGCTNVHSSARTIARKLLVCSSHSYFLALELVETLRVV